MLDWISDTIWSIVTYVPAIFVDQDSPSFEAVRAMFGLLLIAIVIYAIAMMPRVGVAAWMKKKTPRQTDTT
jgi:cbb3-type cytochrome oxidase subunit 1